MDEILYGYGFSYVHLRVTPLVNIAKAVAVENLVLQGLELRRSCANLTMSGPQNFCASSHPPCAPHTCQHITGLWSLHRQFWRWWSIIIYITIVEVDNKLIRAQQNGEISLGAHSEVLTQCIPIASPPVQCAATMPKLHQVSGWGWNRARNAVRGVTTETLPTTSATGCPSCCKLMPCTVTVTLFPTVSCLLSLECWPHLEQHLDAPEIASSESAKPKVGL